jgi:adenosine deaminase
LRHLSQEDALTVLHTSLQYKDKIGGVGLAAMEIGNPPLKFREVFQKAREYGYKTTAHAGEHAGPEYIWQAVKDLCVDRIDHGIRCLEGSALVSYLAAKKIPLTVCPLSNYALGVVPSLALHPFKKMLDAGLLVSLHSDDPVYFGGYIQDVYEQTKEALNLPIRSIIDSARNSFLSSFLDDSTKSLYIDRLIEYIQNNNSNNE